MRSRFRTAIALAAVFLPVVFLGAPVCFSPTCPMSGAERAACQAMGRECCGTKGGQVSQVPAMAALVLAAVPAALALAAPATKTATFAHLSGQIDAAPAILQRVGLFTLFDIFLI